ncbi:chorismate-binding protein [Estrella lausannensis]|uniref:Putative menaquinone-specific isochorismate synthase n=1 Tax=Estrella lausannensis TaxID=483423 RepID=A0A0H5E4J4_9BACT|nr:chorismate-binding protein [Estrella lausannensis]CRX38135.1 Putative menaquinone-specific isochorismate synthase [Estrella lausannensis]
MLDKEGFGKCASLIECDDGFLIGTGKRQWRGEPNPFKPAFFFPPFFLNCEDPFCVHQETFFLDKCAFQAFLNSAQHREEERFVWSRPEKEPYQLQFNLLRKQIESGQLQKGVPYSRRQSIGTIDSGRIFSILRSAFEKRGRGLLYGFWNADDGMLGVTPEKLFVRKDGTIYVDAVAGTRPTPDFKEKESVEHTLVTQGIKEALTPYGEVAVGQTCPIPYGKLLHLYTPIEVKARAEAPFKELVEKLHPTPALGTYPQKEGAAWLMEADRLIPRRRFGAPAGCIIPERGEARCLVAIRSIQWNDGNIEMFAGGGVTDESEVEKEWDEIQSKFQSIEQMLSV